MGGKGRAAVLCGLRCRTSCNISFNIGLARCSVIGRSFLWELRDKSLVSLKITAVSPLT